MRHERASAHSVERAEAPDEGRRPRPPRLARGELGHHRARRRRPLRTDRVLLSSGRRSSGRPALRTRCSLGRWSSAALRGVGRCSGPCSFGSRWRCSAPRSSGLSRCGPVCWWASRFGGLCLRAGSGLFRVVLLWCSPGFSFRCSSGGSALSGSRCASSSWSSSRQWVARLGARPRSRLLPRRPPRPQRRLRGASRSASGSPVSFGFSGVFATAPRCPRAAAAAARAVSPRSCSCVALPPPRAAPL